MSVLRSRGEFSGVGGLRIAWRAWAQEGDAPPAGHVVISHGYGEHGERYARVAERLVAAGFKAWVSDHRGHGVSEGHRGVMDRLAHAVTDLDDVVEMARLEARGAPVFLLGHSMGGAVALAYALEHQDKLAGLILSAAATSWPGGTATPFVPRAAVALASAVVPRASTNRIDKANLTRDPAEHRAYLDDPLIAQRAQPARTLSELLNAFVRFRAETPRLTLPLLVLHGTADRITAPEGSRWLVEHAGSTDKELVLYDGFVHELLNEPPDDRERVTDDIVAWLRTRTPS